MACSDALPASRVPAVDSLPHPQTTAAQLRVYRLALLGLAVSLITLWLVVLATGTGRVDALGNQIGGDFAMFYVAGQMAHAGEWGGLYDEGLQQARLLELIPSLPRDTYLPFRYPPLVAIVAAPLAALPYLPAFALFSFVSLGLWIGSIGQIARRLQLSRNACGGTAVLAIASAPVAVQTLIDGQASLVWFAIAAACWLCLHNQRYVLAGSVLALAACKPNVMLLLTVVLCLRYPRMLLGLLPAGLAMFLITIAVAGAEPLAAYVELGRQLAWKPWQVETPYWKVQSVLSWSELIFGTAARRINMLAGLCGAIALGLAWRRHRFDVALDGPAWCAALMLNALFNPYTPVYDLTLLCLGLLVCCGQALASNRLAEWLQRRDVQATAALVLVGPILSQGVAKLAECPLQIMPLGLLAAGLYWLLHARTAFFGSRCCIGT